MTIAKLAQVGVKAVTTASTKAKPVFTSMTDYLKNHPEKFKLANDVFQKGDILKSMEKCKLSANQIEKMKEQARKKITEMFEQLKRK